MQVGPQRRGCGPRGAAPQDAICMGGKTGDRGDASSGLHAARGGGETLPILVANAARSAAGSISALGFRRCHQRLLAGRPRVAGIRAALAVPDQVAPTAAVFVPSAAAYFLALLSGSKHQVGSAPLGTGSRISLLATQSAT